MSKAKRLIPALILSASLLFAGCGIRPAESGPRGSGGGRQSAESLSQTEPPVYQSDISESTQGADNDRSVTPPSMSVGGSGFTVTNALFCNTDDGGKQILVTGEREGIYMFVAVGSTKAMTANSSFSQEDFGDVGSDMGIAATIMSPASNEIYGGVTPPYLTDVSLSIGNITDDYMEISLSGTIIGTYTFDISGSASLSTLDECVSVVGKYDAIAAAIRSGSENENADLIRCAGCNGDLKCRFCEGDGTCHVCLGLVDHCVDCAGSNICQKCGGNGVCPYCNGEGVIY